MSNDKLKNAIKQTVLEKQNPKGYVAPETYCDCPCHEINQVVMCNCMCSPWPYKPDFTGDIFREASKC